MLLQKVIPTNEPIGLLGCVRVGDGSVAFWHEKKLRALGIEMKGIIDPDPVKQKKAAKRGIKVFSSLAEAAESHPLFWDICCPTKYHLEVIRDIIKIDNRANIIVEKPVCYYCEIEQLSELLKNFKGKLVVNENYITSLVTQKIKELIIDLDITPNKVVSEMTKNRINDFINGRFLDNNLGAFGYEGSHIITNVMALGKQYLPREIGNVFYKDMYIDVNGTKQHLPKQAMVEKQYRAVNGAEVVLYTSMEGQIKHLYPGYSQQHLYQAPEDPHTRYRVLAVEDLNKGITVAGFYEPILGQNRGEGRVVICKDGIVQKIIPHIVDDTMGRTLKNAIEYFQGKRENPCPASVAIGIVEIMNLWHS